MAAAAIGNPERFFAMLRGQGLAIETRTLPDHARFTPALAGAGKGKPVLLTEKDAVKCGGAGWSGAAFVEVTPVVDHGQADSLIDAILRLVGQRRGTET